MWVEQDHKMHIVLFKEKERKKETRRYIVMLYSYSKSIRMKIKSVQETHQSVNQQETVNQLWLIMGHLSDLKLRNSIIVGKQQHRGVIL